MVAMTFQRGGSGGRGHGRGAGTAGPQRLDEVTAAGSRAPKHTKNTGYAMPGSSRSGYGQIHHLSQLHSDHPAVIPKRVLRSGCKSRIDGYDFSKCLMDGEANIMYTETPGEDEPHQGTAHSTTEFHGVVPVPFKSSYHVIFGRPTYHKFHAGHATSTTSSRFRVLKTTKKQISEQKTSFKAAIETKKHDLVEAVPEGPDWPERHAYVDDIAVMTRKGSDLISDLKETFDNLRWYKMMLNPLKCVFGVPAVKLLGFIVSHRGIEVNPEKIKAILNIKRPTCLKDVQRLTGCVAAISRFVSRLGEKSLPLYKLLKKTDKFVWDEEADKALQGLKNILSSPPILAAPAESEPMLLYMAATNKVISLVIVVVRGRRA
ncbi:hypothetical protein QYE76_011791 [Lolium multiflorum]|uniref:Reverse transcriptase domain-containing protein n=1 Tax=Lolium multiflorum TaxID=4521 RepID=A0AAD8TZV0_LOLMU|nr:hypothetical protein QYE76_011791 [Lolium multiflorum]